MWGGPQNVARFVNFSKLPNGQLAPLLLSLSPSVYCSSSRALLLCSVHKSLRDFATQACSILFSARVGSFCFCGLRPAARKLISCFIATNSIMSDPTTRRPPTVPAKTTGYVSIVHCLICAFAGRAGLLAPAFIMHNSCEN